MPINLASPGILVREVDLTIGRVDTATDKTAAIVAAFSKGPVNIPTTVENEADLIDLFGEPTATDSQYEDWMVASSYLSYGGVLSVVRADDEDLKNAFVGAASSIKIRSVDDYTNNGYDENTIQKLSSLGHNIDTKISPIGGAQAIKINENGVLQGASDPRKDGCAIGF